MRREDLRRLFARARDLSGETDYVVLGSLAILGCAIEVPARMAASIDVDAFTKNDPARIFDLAVSLGQGSPFEREYGYYLDPISPQVATLPAGWEGRLTRIQLEASLAAWFLEPNDAAVSKYARMEPRDREWIRPGLRAGVLSLAILDARFPETSFIDSHEAEPAVAPRAERPGHVTPRHYFDSPASVASTARATVVGTRLSRPAGGPGMPFAQRCFWSLTRMRWARTTRPSDDDCTWPSTR
jgi:hypothetical protein